MNEENQVLSISGSIVKADGTEIALPPGFSQGALFLSSEEERLSSLSKSDFFDLVDSELKSGLSVSLSGVQRAQAEELTAERAAELGITPAQIASALALGRDDGLTIDPSQLSAVTQPERIQGVEPPFVWVDDESPLSAEEKAEREFFAHPDFIAHYRAPSGSDLSVRLRGGSLLHLIDETPVSDLAFRDALMAIPGSAWVFKVEGSGKEFIVRRPDEKKIHRSNAKILQLRANAAKMHELSAWNADIEAKRLAKKSAKRGLAMPAMTK